MPPHPDRVRKNYENSKFVIKFRGIPIHSCNKIPNNYDMMAMLNEIENCPWCGEGLSKLGPIEEVKGY